MFLKELHLFQPKQYGYFLHSQPLAFAAHPSSNYLAFSSRQSNLIVYNRKTGRICTYLKSENGILSILFTQKYLIAIEKGVHEILVYSLKSEKIKKKMTGHRSQVLKVSYCPQRNLFATISQDVCIIWDEGTLTSLKWLKCSTSSYCDCNFSQNGQNLFTSFADGNVFNWNLNTFQYQTFALQISSHALTSNDNQFLFAYQKNKMMGSDFSKSVFSFQKIQPFWEGTIENVGFINDYIALKTAAGLYIAQVRQEHRIVIKNVKLLKDPIYDFIIGGYGSQLLIIHKDLTKIRTMQIFSEPQSNKIPLTNPLLNQGEYCGGGFSHQTGCRLVNEYENGQTYDYKKQEYKVENLNGGMYSTAGFAFSDEKLKNFIRKNHFFPDKYRPSAYKFLLGLPINQSDFLLLQRKKRHECTQLIAAKYPLQNQKLFESMQNMVSLLANYCPVFAESDLIAPIVFPFVCLFGNDEYFCFEVLYKLLRHWLSFLFSDFPLANTRLLQNIYEILEIEDMPLLMHLKEIKAPFTKLVWGILSNFFTTTFNREIFLSIVDNLFANYEDPSLIIFILLGYLSYQRSTLLTMRSEKDLDQFLDSEQTVNTGQLLKKGYNLREKYERMVRYRFIAVNREQCKYEQFTDFPPDAVKMYEGKRKLQHEQFNRVMDNERHQENLALQMQKIIVRTKKENQKAIIEAESVALQNETELKNKLTLPVSNQSARIKKLNHLINQITSLLNANQSKKTTFQKYLPSLNPSFDQKTEEELNQIENQLMNLLTKLQPNKFDKPLKSQPIGLQKREVDRFDKMKAARNGEISNRLWDLDRIEVGNQERNWEKDFEMALKK